MTNQKARIFKKTEIVINLPDGPISKLAIRCFENSAKDSCLVVAGTDISDHDVWWFDTKEKKAELVGTLTDEEFARCKSTGLTKTMLFTKSSFSNIEPFFNSINVSLKRVPTKTVGTDPYRFVEICPKCHNELSKPEQACPCAD